MRTRTLNMPCFMALLILSVLFACQQAANVKKNEAIPEKDTTATSYINPVYNQNFADPTVIRGGDGYFYAYGTNATVNEKMLNIQVMRSEDLVHWEHMGDALPDKPVWADQDFWAPHVSYDSLRQTYYLYYSGESKAEGTGKCLGVASAKSPVGPFIDKGEPLLCGEGFVNIDPMAFDDPVSGKKLLYWGSGFQPIKVQELADDRMSFKPSSKPVDLVQPITNGDPDNYQNLVEGGWVVYHNGYYYMFYSGDNCCGAKAHYAVMVARAKNAEGPFETLASAEDTVSSVILSNNEHWLAPGHNSIVSASGHDWIVYHAINPASRDKGRVMLIDEIVYQDGWPHVSDHAPSSEPQPAPVINQ